jgi:hypothetical protein
MYSTDVVPKRSEAEKTTPNIHINTKAIIPIDEASWSTA